MDRETPLAPGDSITIGARTYPGYPDYAAHLLSKATNKHWNGVNFAKSGITSIELNRMPAHAYENLRAPIAGHVQPGSLVKQQIYGI